MIKNFKNNIKIILPLILLILMFMILTLNAISTQYFNKKNIEISQNKLFLAIKLSDVLHEMQKERGMAVGFISSKGRTFINQLKLQQSISDKSIKDLFFYFASMGNFNDKLEIKKILEKKLQFKKLRLNVHKLLISKERTLSRYTIINSEILQVIVKITKTSSLANLSHNVIAYINFLYFKENVGIERGLGTDLILSRIIKNESINKFNATIVKQDLYKKLFLNYADEDFSKHYKSNFQELNIKKMEKTISDGKYSDTSAISVKIWFSNMTQKIDSLNKIKINLTNNIIFTMNKKLEHINGNLIIFFSISLISFIIYMFIIFLILKFIKQDKVHKELINKYIITSSTNSKGIITEVSDAFVNISGFTREELIGSSHNMVRHQDMSKEIFNDLWTTIKNGKTWTGNVKNRTKDGGYYWVIATIEPIFGRNKEIIAYTAVRQDITDKMEISSLNKTLEYKIDKEVEENRKKDKTMLQQSRLAQMGEMISMIAHQWRQPLTAISATSSNLTFKAKLDTLDNDTAVELGEKISDYAQHLSSTIDDFRSFFQTNKEKREITYKELIKSVLSIIEISVQNKDIKLKQNLQSEVTFTTYPNELKQVILNLIKNAEDILLEKEIENPTITIETQDNILKIKDNAGGVPDDIIDKVFNPYFSTKTKKDGTGLGLYMSKTIIEEHCGGKLSVSNDECGAVFEIKLKI